jgi:hypothetical protein
MTVAAETSKNFQFFLPIEKVDKKRRTVSGYASTPALDSDGEIISLKAVKAALPGYMEYGNIREMHALKAVGTASEANIDEKGLYLTAKIVDDAAWKKCVEGVYKGFSIGGAKLAKAGNIVTQIDMSEISVVDRPANPECKFNVAKMAKAQAGFEAYLVPIPKAIDPAVKAATRLAKTANKLLKDASVVGKDQFETPAKGETKPNGSPDLVPNPLDYQPTSDGDEKAKRKALKAEKKSAKKALKAEVLKKVQASAAALQGQKVKDVLAKYDINGGKAGLALGKLETGNFDIEPAQPDFLSLGAGVPGRLEKGLGVASSLTYAFGSLRDAQRSLALEGKDEGGDGKDTEMSKRLGQIAKELAGIISDKALHEGGEALDMSDVDDRWVNQTLGKDKGMSKVNGGAAAVDDGLLEALAERITGQLLGKAMKKSAKEIISDAKKSFKMARKARGEAKDCIEKAHAMCKAKYLAKAAGKKDEDTEFDDEACMKMLKSAHDALAKAESADDETKMHLKKAEGAIGEDGQRVQDSDGKFFMRPDGITPLNQGEISRASPGGNESGTEPPLYPATGEVYPGKSARSLLAKFAGRDGRVPAEIIDLVAANERMAGQIEVYGTIPRQGAQPKGFNMQKAFGQGADQGQRGKAIATIFEGVDVGAIGSGDESLHKSAAGKAIGQMLTNPNFGRSIFDSSFKGKGSVADLAFGQ